jgi:hypothetical protein
MAWQRSGMSPIIMPAPQSAQAILVGWLMRRLNRRSEVRAERGRNLLFCRLRPRGF